MVDDLAGGDPDLEREMEELAHVVGNALAGLLPGGAEPLAVLLTIVLTFIGAAAAYRLNLHMNVSYFADQLPPRYRRLLDLLVQLLMALIAVFMIVWGALLVEVTWHNTIADFPFLSVGITYLPIPVGGICLLLFIIERIFLGAPPDPILHTHDAVSFD